MAALLASAGDFLHNQLFLSAIYLHLSTVTLKAGSSSVLRFLKSDFLGNSRLLRILEIQFYGNSVILNFGNPILRRLTHPEFNF